MTGTVFVTGVAGLLGSHLAEHYVARGWRVAGIDDLSGGDRDNVPAGVEFRVADCLDRSAYADLIEDADLVYHCAAAAYDGLSIFAPAFVYRSVVQATVEVMTAMLGGRARRFVLCSSMARYGAAGAEPFTEAMPPAPVTPYGWAKVAAEHAVENLARLHGREFAIAVPHNVIGPHQNYTDPYRNVAAIMTNRMLQGLPPVIYGDGSQVRCFSVVGDVTRSLAALGELPEAAGALVNVGPDEDPLTVRELARLLAEIIGVDDDPLFLPARPHEVAVAVCDSTRARELLGYETRTSLPAGLEELVAWIRERGPRPFRYDRVIEIGSPEVPRTWTERLL